jgi:hypothetical protein
MSKIICLSQPWNREKERKKEREREREGGGRYRGSEWRDMKEGV